LDIRNIPAIETLIASSLGLVTVEKSSSTLRLIHYTLQEYLSHNPGLFLKPHSMISEVCLTYLNFRHIRGFSPNVRSIPPTIPFVKYASCYWGTHARRETSESVKSLALELLDGYDKHISSRMLLLHGMDKWEWPLDEEDSPRGFSGLHGASYFGCEEITVALLEVGKWDVQATDFNGNTAITWAARRGHSGVVRILLELGNVDPNTTDTKHGRTPLSWAADSNNEGVVRVLLERNDVDLNTVDTEYGRTPLSWAAESNNEGVVRMLLERNDIDPNIADTECGRTPLSWAAGNGHEVVVKMLLERKDVDPSIADTEYGQTPLSWAATGGHEAVVRMLLERKDVDPSVADTKDGQTPLSWAAENGHEAVVRMLLERNDVDPNRADIQYGRGPHVIPARGGGILAIVLGGCAHYGQTPLVWATEKSHEAVVRMLLERNDTNPNKADA